ncbi:MAG: VOC family protein [Geminicoccaceae bacterium]|nr:VOC family protein [Geminicoccaceae bacterium]
MRFEQAVTFVYTDDLERSAAFYGDRLGLRLVLDQGACRIFEAAPNAFIGACRRGRRSPSPDGVILTLVTQDVDGWYERLKAQGLSIDRPPKANPEFGIYHFFVEDPEGYLIEIQRFDSPDWPAAVQGPVCSTST